MIILGFPRLLINYFGVCNACVWFRFEYKPSKFRQCLKSYNLFFYSHPNGIIRGKSRFMMLINWWFPFKFEWSTTFMNSWVSFIDTFVDVVKATTKRLMHRTNFLAVKVNTPHMGVEWHFEFCVESFLH